MAAPVLESTANTGWRSSASDVTITKPSGLAVGDLLLAMATGVGNVLNAAPTGFTLITNQTDGAASLKSTLSYKIADSADVSATDFTFPGVAVNHIWSLTRISGNSQSAESYKFNSGAASNTGTPSIAATITPKSYGDSTLLLQYWCSSTGTSDVTTYAIATSNPSWTEGYDVDSTNQQRVSMASAARPEVTATGNVSCAGGGGTTDWGVIIISIPVTYTATGSDTLAMVEGVKQDIDARIDESLAMVEDSDADKQGWTNTNKSSSTWTNLDKS